MTAAVSAWAEAVLEAAGRDRREEALRFTARVPAGYRERVGAAQAVEDIEQISSLERSGPPPGEGADPDRPTTGFGGAHRLTVRADPKRPGLLRLRRHGWTSVELSSWLPVLASFGLAATEVSAAVVAPDAGRPAVHIDDFGLRPEATAGTSVDPSRLVAALEAVTAGRADTDALNRLVVDAGLTWRQAALIRAYRRYRRQAGSSLSDAALDAPLLARPHVASRLVALFEARFDPDLGPERRAVAERAAREALREALDQVESLEVDRTLRGLLALIEATTRTSYFLTGDDRADAPLVLKLESARVPDLPVPRPMFETWVHGTAVEGIHLRFGRVARGGLRWSDRPADFRTEVLDLADAQVKKNAVIVPTGAKGGFVCRWDAPTPEAVRNCYRSFVSSLLDVTDNLVDGRVVTPARVVAHDGEDPYLVVAADRGTATFSDLANSVALERGFWLGDAFASGGSHGYDHKAMGITARGAWVAVERHFRQLGIDVDREPVSAVGIGDMSGDVFGNGMLRSRSLRLVAAFDHRHVFIDPDPDPGRSFDERARLAGLARSSWDDYDRTCLSDGGGVWSRAAKSISLHPAARRALGITAEELTPPELVSAVLSAPVDLVWFGGIGTYVRSPDESDADVGDPANDEVRITADRLRARVVAEGGNLGITQRARIRYSRRGGRINTDFIDNAAGVATSDREVNFKILLGLAIEQGRLGEGERDAVLAAVEGHVADDVLRQVDHAVDALNRAVPASAADLDAHEALLDDLERKGRVDRTGERLPDAEEWQRRRNAGAGLIRPELAVLLAVAKSELAGAIAAADVAGSPAFADSVIPYFAPVIRERFGDLVPRHRLYRELVGTDVAGEIVDRMGIAWAHESAAELGRPLADVAAAFWAARQVLGAGGLWDEIEGAGREGLDADAEAGAHGLVREAVGALARRYLVTVDRPVERIAADRRLVDELRAGAALRPGTSATTTDLPGDLPERLAVMAPLAVVPDLASIATRSGRDPAQVLRAVRAVDTSTGLGPLAAALHVVGGRWTSWAARAILDDMATWGARAAAEALAGSGDAPEAAVAAWVATRRESLARATNLVSSAGGRPTETVAVALLVVRSLP